MVRTKLIDQILETIAALKEDAAAHNEAAEESMRLAEELEIKIKQSPNGVEPGINKGKRGKPKHLRRKGHKRSYLVLAVDVLREQKKPLHLSELVPMVGEKRGETVSRASVESALVRGMETAKWKGVIRRTAPGTFAVQ